MVTNHHPIWSTFVTLLLATTWAAAPSCESMTSCDLYAELQEHSKLIAGFSYNVKKADNALTQLRAEKISLMNRVKILEEALREGENDTVILTNKEAINELTRQDKELETGINTLSKKLNELREEVEVIFINNIRNNDKDLEDLQSRVILLNKVVERLETIVKNHTEYFGLITLPDGSEITDRVQMQVSLLKVKHGRLDSLVKQLLKTCGIHGGRSSLDSLGIELETVKSAYDTLQDQVTELQDKCATQNGQLEKMLQELTKRVEEVEKKWEEGEKKIGQLNVVNKVDRNGEKVAVVRISTPP